MIYRDDYEEKDAVSEGSVDELLEATDDDEDGKADAPETEEEEKWE